MAKISLDSSYPSHIRIYSQLIKLSYQVYINIQQKYCMSTEPPKKANEPHKKISIKQFQWYEVETKVRELLTQLLQPFTKKQTEDTVKMNEYKRNLQTMQKKLQDHDFLLTQESVQKPTYVQLQDDKICELQKKLTQMQIEQNKQINDMQKVIEVYQNKITQINQIQSRIDSEIKERSNQVKEHKEYLDQQIDLMLKRLENQDMQLNTLRQTTRNAITKIETRTVVVENRLTTCQDQMKRKTQEIKRSNDQIININEKLASVDLSAKELDARLLERQKDYKLSEKFLAKAIQLQNSVSFISNYLQFYQPLYTQMQISETINSFLKGPMKTRACLYEQKIFAQMHYAILTMQEDTLETRMGDYGNRIRKIINRNKKYIIKMKIEHTIKYGTNIYQIRQLDESLLQRSEQLVKNSQPQQVIVPEEQITKIVEQKWEKLLNGVENKVEQKLSPFKIWLKQMQQQTLIKQIQIEKKLAEFKSKMQRQEVNMELFKSVVEQIEKQLKKSLDYIYKQIRKSKDQIKEIINFSSVVNHIVIQDEIDRQGLALYALKSGTGKGDQNYQQGHHSIQIDQKCVSCQNGNSSMIVNQAFKMACLAYNPSEIKIDDHIFSREQILQISTNLLDKLKKKLDQIEVPDKDKPEKRQSISSQKNQYKNRSKSSASKQVNRIRGQSNTIDIPNSSRLRDTTYLLPVLGAVKKKSSIGSQRQKITF